MSLWSSSAPTVLASFLASMVEFVEALTIVLAVGLTRGWKPALAGTASGLAVLGALLLVLGPSLSAIPLPVLQLAVGVLLLLFGLRWLRKAILRSAGVIPLHDESQVFTQQSASLRGSQPTGKGTLDSIAFLSAFKAVVLEGVEVVFVVLAFGVRGGLLLPAAAGALLALLLVVALGVLLHKPLTRVPENTLKFGVGLLLTAFGSYWVGEGIGIGWPWSDATILALIAVFLAVASGLTQLCRRAAANAPVKDASSAGSPSPAKARSGVLMEIGGELLGLFIDDLPLALGTVGWIAVLGVVQARGAASSTAMGVLIVAGLVAVLAGSAWRRAAAPRAPKASLV
ncbi:hypothetical protein HHL11_23490 [Ramlibacter sp. G-1-2-2]|uniref:GDT1 family protein n=1 Tax=Ramlibacter agri TaxID=2728837 RepID=A0A848H8D1_9BURK|nr:hypothetical protein [Ramlibacter agri]NML46727.1 hypothetical protein [Ramlibacter agri]